jgi:hypothetical protein
MTKEPFSDRELDLLLSKAKQPQLPLGFAERLQAKLTTEATSNVIAFPQKRIEPAPSRLGFWFSAVPLAASLAAGIYLGAMGELPAMFSGLQDAVASLSADTGLDLGIEDTESFLNGELS